MKGVCYFQLPNSSTVYCIEGTVSIIENIQKPPASDGFKLLPFDSSGLGKLLQGKTKIVSVVHTPAFCLYNQKKNTYIEKAAYCNFVTKTVDEIKKGELEKVVISRVKEVKKEETFSASLLFEKLCKQYKHAFIYYYTDEEEQWIGASPEIFITGKETYKTVALAGTKTSNSMDSFTEKEFEEQDYIVSYIRDVFKKLNLPFTEHERKEVQAGNLKHLATFFEWFDTKADIATIGKLLHPTPAVAGIPKQKACDYITDLETHNRTFYSGIVGFSENKSQQLFVNLRCMKILKETLELYAGAGITANSIAENEWIETENKIDTLLSIIQQQ